MALEVGDRIAHYDVTALIGEGGMGQVYQATDTKLNRQVALKILPEAFATDPDRLARFQREAQVLASLNHPGIAAIYGIEESEDTRALVLELVEGPTLADRISKGPIPIDEALPIAKQIAEALEAAHEAGVIHRDLKPANIKVREDGTVKVLDFGLAKALNPTPTGDPSESPTLTAAATQMGVIMGTAAYMSPEQARGKPVDKRADIWAFGVVLYEMLTGQRAFQGEDVSLTLASVMKTAVDITPLPGDVPANVRTVLRRCLEKDPSHRVRDIGDVRLAMDGAFQSDDDTAAGRVVAGQLKFWQRPVSAVLGAVVIASLTSVAVWSITGMGSPGGSPPVRFVFDAGPTDRVRIAQTSPDVAVSPDGQHVAYLTGGEGRTLGSSQLQVRSLSDFTPTTLAGGAPLYSPFFSPDGEWVGYYDLHTLELRRVSVDGGAPLLICTVDSALRGVSWGDDDTIVFATNDTGLWRVDARGGDPEPLLRPDETVAEVSHRWPHVLPGSRAVLFTVLGATPTDSHIAVLSMDSGEQTIVARGGSYGQYAATGHLVYSAEDSLRALPFDPDRLEATGDPIPVLEGVMTKASGAANFAVSPDGSLVYIAGIRQQQRHMVWVDRQGREEGLNATPALYESPRISPDGRYVAVEVRDGNDRDIMVYDIERETPTTLTFEPGIDGYPIWTPDSRYVLFGSDRDGAGNVYSKAADGTGQVERVTTSEDFQWPESLTGDGETLIVGNNPGGRFDIHVLSLSQGTQTEGLLVEEFDSANTLLSPDGQWVAYQSNESGDWEVYVRPFPNLDDGRWQISRSGGQSPRWAPNGRELFFRQLPAGEMMAVDIIVEPTFSPGNPEVLFEAPYLLSSGGLGRTRTWDVAGDGRFLMVKQDSAEAAGLEINVVLNWAQELLERVPIP